MKNFALPLAGIFAVFGLSLLVQHYFYASPDALNSHGSDTRAGNTTRVKPMQGVNETYPVLERSRSLKEPLTKNAAHSKQESLSGKTTEPDEAGFAEEAIDMNSHPVAAKKLNMVAAGAELVIPDSADNAQNRQQ